MGTLKLTAASGGGSVSIEAPASSSNNRVITLPDITNGTLVTSESTLDATKLSGNLPAISGANLTGISAGITEADCWRITSGFETTSATITANWERVDDYASYVGSGMVESSGVFTFPSTGVWHLSFFSTANASNARTYVGITIKDNTSGNLLTEAYDSTAASNYYTNLHCECFFDVTDTSNNKIYTRVESTSTTEWKGSSNRNLTAITFIRLGDT